MHIVGTNGEGKHHLKIEGMVNPVNQELVDALNQAAADATIDGNFSYDAETQTLSYTTPYCDDLTSRVFALYYEVLRNVLGRQATTYQPPDDEEGQWIDRYLGGNSGITIISH